jgi:hypothetical protein
MKILVSLLFALLVQFPAYADQESFDARAFAQNYFDAWAATQSPQAGAEDIEHYLGFLADDVGHQHLPYDPDSSRDPEGKNKMREGMTYYLGAHMEYKSSLNEILPGFEVVIIKYDTYAKGKHPQTGEVIEQSYDTVEVLELEAGKVSVIRKYSE